MVGCLFFSFDLSFFCMKVTVYQKRKRAIILSNFGIGSKYITHYPLFFN
jgi:hypothetical protein